MYQAGLTIYDLLQELDNNLYALPAIQREFVWKPEQICLFFDSLMQGYPFGSFLFWKLSPRDHEKYQLYKFMQNYHARDNYHCSPFEANQLPNQDIKAVLDGQQRMTALNIGLQGSYTWKLPRKRYTSDHAYPQRFLYLNLLGQPDLESGTKFHFEFLTEDKAAQNQNGAYWFKCCRLFKEEKYLISGQVMNGAPEELQRDETKKKLTFETLNTLMEVVFSKHTIFSFEEDSDDLERVLNIFIRLNNGGTELSYSDLLLSIATSQWNTLDARDEIHSLVDEMNAIKNQFSFTKDLVLKAGLMLSNIGGVGFNVKNFTKSNMKKIEDNWQEIRRALLLTVELIAQLGFTKENLKANSSILPLAYHIYHQNISEDILYKTSYRSEREKIRHWLIRSLLKQGVWGSGLDTLLTLLRSAIIEANSEQFPIKALETQLTARGKSLKFEFEEIEELAELTYGDKRTSLLLSLLFEAHDHSFNFEVDHIYPKYLFTEKNLDAANVAQSKWEEFAIKKDKLANLTLLEQSANNEKRYKMPHEWFSNYSSVQLKSLGIDYLPKNMVEFDSFYQQRNNNLLAMIQTALVPSNEYI